MADDSQMATMIDRLGGLLPHYGFRSDADLRLLCISENATFLITDRGAERSAVLRVYRPGYHTRADIDGELAWVQALAADRVADVVRPIADRSGVHIQTLPDTDGRPDRFVVLFDYMTGTEPSPDDDLIPWFEVLGELTARLHAHARSWRRPAGFTRQVWDTSAMHGARHLWGRWQDALGLDAPGQAVLGRAVTAIDKTLAEYGQSPERFGLIHADLRLTNLLIDGPRLKLLDFDDSGFSWFMYDFAAAISFYEHLPNVPALREAWFAGYGRVGTITPADRAIVPTLVLARRILLCAWIASHREVPFAQQLGATYTKQSVALAEAYLGGHFLAD